MATKEEILESIAAMSVMEVSELIKMMEEKFGVVAAAAAVAAGVPAGWTGRNPGFWSGYPGVPSPCFRGWQVSKWSSSADTADT